MRVTIDLMKKSTQIIDLSNVINPRVGDDDLLLPLHICYGDNLYDMRDNDVEFITQDTNKNNIYIAGTCNTNTPGDNLYTGDLTFRFPAGTFKVDGTYDPDQTMFRIVDKATQKVISSVNVKITVMKNAIEFNFNPDNSSYDSRAETMLQDFHDKGQAMLDEITSLNNQAKSNVSGDTAATANEAKQQANANASDISDLEGEVAGARGRFADLPGREDAQDTAINQKESIANANANYAVLQQNNARLEERQTALSASLSEKFSQFNVNPEFFTDLNELATKYPTGKEGIFILDNGHTAIYQNGWQDSGHSITVGSFQFKAFVDVNEVTAPYDSLDTLPTNSVVFYAPDVTEKFLVSPTDEGKKALIVITLGADASYTSNYIHIQEVIDRDSGIKYTRSSWYDYNGKGGWYSWHSNDFNKAIIRATQNLMFGQDITKWSQNVLGKVQLATDVQYHSTPIMHITGTAAGQWNHLVSEEIPVDQTIISVQLPEMITNEVYGSSNVYLNIVPLADGEKYGDQSTTAKIIYLGLSNSTIGLHSYPNLNLPVGTEKIVIDVVQYGIGDVYFGIPAVNYGPKCIPYSPSAIADDFDQVNKQISDNFNVAKDESCNLLYGQDIRNWTNQVKGEFDSDQSFNGTPIVHIKGTQTGQWNNWVSAPIEIDNTLVSLQLPQMSANEVYGQSNVYVSLSPLADGEKLGDDSVNKKTISYTLGNTQLSLSKFENIKLPADTKSLVISFIQYGIGDLYFGIPVLNYGASCIVYNAVQLGKNIDRSDAVVPQLYISADSSRTGYDKTPVSFKLIRKSGIDYGYLNFDIQGDSSRSYPKKNFKIKLFNDPDGKTNSNLKPLSSWKSTNNYNLKANWIDATHSRNIVNARLVKDAVSVTPLENPDQTEKILSTEGLGQIDGFPIELYFNDGYHGLYTLNTKKDETTFGMDSTDVTNEVLSTELGKNDITDPTKAIIDGKNWSTEIHDVASDNVKSNLVKFLDFIDQSSDTDFRANLKNYIDVSSVINLILFGWLSQEYDFYSKSELFATWNDGAYWYLIPYDLDSTWGLSWDGSDVTPNRDDFNLSKIFSDPQTAWAASANDNKLQQRVISLFKPEIKKQGNFLRSTVWSTPNIIANFKAFIDEVPTFAYQRDQDKWTTIPSKSKTDFVQLQSTIIQRGQEFDNFLSQLA